MPDQPKLKVWVGSSRRDLKAFPKRVRSDIGQALYTAQMGETDPAAKPLKGFGAALGLLLEGVQHINHVGELHRVYGAIGVRIVPVDDLHHTRAIATPQKDLDLIRRRLAEAQRLYRQRSN